MGEKKTTASPSNIYSENIGPLWELDNFESLWGRLGNSGPFGQLWAISNDLGNSRPLPMAKSCPNGPLDHFVPFGHAM